MPHDSHNPLLSPPLSSITGYFQMAETHSTINCFIFNGHRPTATLRYVTFHVPSMRSTTRLTIIITLVNIIILYLQYLKKFTKYIFVITIKQETNIFLLIDCSFLLISKNKFVNFMILLHYYRIRISINSLRKK